MLLFCSILMYDKCYAWCIFFIIRCMMHLMIKKLQISKLPSKLWIYVWCFFLLLSLPQNAKNAYTLVIAHIFYILFLNRIFNYNYEIIKTRHCVVLYVISAAPKNIIIKKNPTVARSWWFNVKRVTCNGDDWEGKVGSTES